MTSYTNKKVNIVLFEIGIFLLPYDAIPHLMPSTYTPISLYALLLSLLFSISNIKLDSASKRLFIFVLYSIGISIITVSYYVGSYHFFGQFLITMFMGLMAFLSMNLVLRQVRLQKTCQRYVDYLLSLLGKAYVIPMFLGFLEFLAMQGILPYSVKLFINHIFGGWQSRLCMTTLEASWASMHMLIAFSSYLYLYFKERKKRFFIGLIFSVFFFFALASTQGILTFVIALIIYVFISQFMKKNLANFLKNVMISLVGISLVTYIFYEILLLMPTSYFASRILNFTSLSNLLANDSSTFIRVGYLVIHLLIFKDHLIFGVGGGNFNNFFVDYIIKYFPASANLPEVAGHIDMGDAGTTVSMYFSILSELGIIGLIIFIAFIKNILSKIKYFETMKNTSSILLFISILLALPIQFGSWAYVPFWMGLAFTNNLMQKINKQKNNEQGDYYESQNRNSYSEL